MTKMDMETILNELKNLDLDAYREIIAYCESRSTGTEGIPAIIGLDRSEEHTSELQSH